MGFPVGYTEVSLSSLLLNTLSLLGLFRGFLLSLLHALGLSSILEPAPPSPNRPFPSPHALLIRDRLPVMRFSDALDSSTALLAESCTVCLHEFRDEEEVRWPINCRHIFHRSCLDGWIDQDHRTCPLCRAHLLGPHLVHDLRQPLVFPHDRFDDDDDDDDNHDFHDHHPWPEATS